MDRQFTEIMSYLNRVVNALDWLGHLFLAFMFIVSIWKPERIFGRGSFRTAMVLFAFSIAVPAVVTGWWNLSDAAGDEEGENPTYMDPAYYGGRGSQSSADLQRERDRAKERAQSLRTKSYTTALAFDFSRILLAIAVCCGVLSLLEPEHVRHRRERAAEMARGGHGGPPPPPGHPTPPTPPAHPIHRPPPPGP